MTSRMLVRVDESGIHDGATVCAVVGYAASSSQWELFNSDWRSVHRQFRVEDGFHGRVFFSRGKIQDKKRNPYATWSDQKANDYFGALLSVINGRKLIPVGGGVDVPAFDSLPYGEQCALSGYWKKRGRRRTSAPIPYHLAFRMMLVDAGDATHPDSELHFVVARHKEYEQRAIEAYAQMRKHVPQHEARFKSLRIAEPIDEPGLQAADLIARYYAKGWAAARLGRRQSKEDVSAIKRLGRRRLGLPFCGSAQMEELLNDIEEQYPNSRAELRLITPELGAPARQR